MPIFFTDRDLGNSFPRRLSRKGILVRPHSEHFSDTATDEEWLKAVGRYGWYVITRDRRIRYKPNEQRTVLAAGVGVFLLVGKATPIELADNFIAIRRRIEAFIRRTERPFIAKVYRPEARRSKVSSAKAGRVELWLTH